MKIGILTFHFAVNYGAVIQAWALSRYLTRLGHEVTEINYIPWIYRYPKWLLAVKAFVCHPFRFTADKLFANKFASFVKRNSVLSKLISRKKSFRCLNYDVCIVGSDQVWNIEYFRDASGNFDSHYFLDGVDGEKIAYAASIGEGKWEKDANQLSSYLNRFHAVSVRENFARQVVGSISSAPVCVVPDPTLLLNRDDYTAIAKFNRKTREYIFVYCLADIEKCIEETCKQLKANPKLVAYVSALNRNVLIPVHPRINRVWPSPEEWIGYIQNAAMVITNSFHGMMVSLILGTRLFVIEKGGEHNANNRFRTVLDRMNLNVGVIIEPNERIDEMLSEYRMDGVEFLRKSLSTHSVKSGGVDA